jgi:hypothetical protein
MKLPFLRTPEREGEPTVVAMTGVRLGDKVHFWGSRAAILLPLAAKSGLSGQVTVVSPDPAPLLATAEGEGLLVDANPADPSAGYDLAVVHTEPGWIGSLAPLLAASRPGGRLVVIAGEPSSGLLGRLRGSTAPAPTDADVTAAMTSSGWQRVRPIGERDGMRFVEGVRT